MDDSQALVPAPQQQNAIQSGYCAPRPGRSLRSNIRSAVLLGGSMGIGTGVALGWFGLAPAVLLAVGLATTQVVAQSFHQNRLGQDVMGGIAGRDLEKALSAAEKALQESPTGAMRTLAAANLASVLMQMDRIAAGARVLNSYPPRWPHVPISTVLWNNNRAFAALIDQKDEVFASELLRDAEIRLAKAGIRGFGGVHNWRKISAAVAGTRAMQCLAAGDPRLALSSLNRSAELDDALAVPFRTAERELCRAEALRQLGRKDEATLVATTLRDVEMTPRQLSDLEMLEDRLKIPRRSSPPIDPTPMDDGSFSFRHDFAS